MDEIVYQSSVNYYNALENLGYLSNSNSEKLLLLGFYWEFISNDYRGILSKEDYCKIERALECLYGSTCLIPYPEYEKMGHLKLGEITEISQRIKNLEDTKVLKSFKSSSVADLSDIIISEEEEYPQTL